MTRTIKQAGVLLAVLLLPLGAYCWQAKPEPRPESPARPERGSLLAGVRLSSWHDGKRLCSLEIKTLNAVPKRWGPFKLADSQDLQAVDCRVEVEQAALAASIREIGETLAQMLKAKISGPGGSSDCGADASPSLLILPPQVTAAPFTCRVIYAGGKWTRLRADQAVFTPGQPELQLQGNVQVTASSGAALTADYANWQAAAQQLAMAGKYDYRRPGRAVHGAGALFSLAHAGIKKIKPRREDPQETGPAPPAPGDFFFAALSGKRLAGAQRLMPLLKSGPRGGETPLAPDAEMRPK